jgi:Ni/Co efflux regulator RcnB
MKRLILALAAAIAVAGPLAVGATAAQADPKWDRHGERHDERHGDRRDNREDRRGPRWDRDEPGRGDRGRHNGYYYGNRWYYGPPPAAYYDRPGYRPAYVPWRRGAYLAPRYRGYIVDDYYRYHLRPPPRGYAWYRVGDAYLLTALASGLIFDIIEN